MPNLGDYLGLLLSEITIARMHADLEAVRVAELYASHPLLRYMPVPRFRLPDVQIDVPVAIQKMEEPTPGAPPRGAPTVREMRKTFDKVLASWNTKERIRMSAEVKSKLKLALDEKVAAITKPAEIAVDIRRVADELSGVVSAVLTEAGGPFATRESAQVKTLVAKLREAARMEFLQQHKPPPRLKVLVTTPEIREAGPSEATTRFQLKISEEAVEWTTIESDGDQKDRLIPE